MGLVTGALVAFGGASIVKGIWSVIEGHRELNRELERTKQLGGEFAATVPQARAHAFQMNTPRMNKCRCLATAATPTTRVTTTMPMID